MCFLAFDHVVEDVSLAIVVAVADPFPLLNVFLSRTRFGAIEAFSKDRGGMVGLEWGVIEWNQHRATVDQK